MKRPRTSTVVILIQSILVLACLVFIGLLLADNYFLKQEAKNLAATAGIGDAVRNYANGRFWLYETKLFSFGEKDGRVPDDGSSEPSGKSEGKFEIRYYMISKEFEWGHIEIQQAFVDAYNERMHLFIEHPEWFDENGQRLPLRNQSQHTNAVSTSN
jgi:hypothetical protein